MRTGRTLGAVLLALALLSGCGEGQETLATTAEPLTWSEHQRLEPLDPSAADLFARSVSLDRTTALIGSHFDDNANGTNAGAAYVFVRDGDQWVQQQKLLASDGKFSDGFGYVVSVSGDTAIVGAASADHPAGVDAGAAYVFVRSGGVWTQQQKLVASDAAAGDAFGIAVAVSGESVVIGAFGDDRMGGGNTSYTDAGAAYVFVRTGNVWTEQQKLVASDAAAGDRFGLHVAIEAETAVIGAPRSDHSSLSDPGAAYVFVRSGSTWSQQGKLVASDAAADDELGDAVSISGNTVVAGAPSDSIPGSFDVGGAYVFVRSGSVWTQQQKLSASDGAEFDSFGWSVAVKDDVAVIGAQGDDNANSVNAGAAYTFVRANAVWTEQQKLLAATGDGGDGFGNAVSVGTGIALVGAPRDDTLVGSDVGAAYVFFLVGTSCTLPSECATGHCVNGVCCQTACDGGCGRCDVAGALGTCSAVSSGEPGDPSCAPYLCDGAGTSCPATCVTSADCIATHACTSGSCVARPLGATCSSSSQCPSGFCVDGVCCESACDASCARCNAQGFAGMCQPELAGTAGAASCAPYVCDGTSLTCPASCTSDAGCAATFYCASDACIARKTLGTSCAAANECLSGFCADGVCCDIACDGSCAACTANGQCGPLASGSPGDPSCAPYSCNGSSLSCPTTCSDDAVCALDAYCAADNTCAAQKSAGEACASDRECIDGRCVDGVCCQSACDGPCEACNVAGALGTCNSFCPVDTDCEAATDTCVERAGTCDGDHTISYGNGTSMDCTPYACTSAGTCYDVCQSTSQCASGYVCTSANRCARPETPPGDPGGCGCRSSGGSGSLWLVVFGIGLTVLRRRRWALAALLAGAGCDEPAESLSTTAGAVTWAEHQKLVASDAASSDLLGFAIGLDGATAVAGTATHDLQVGANAGAAYVFTRSGQAWMQQQKLTASDAAAADAFGVAVGVSSDTILVGARGDDHVGGTDAGAVYVFEQSGTSWAETAKLVASDAAASDQFGHVLALEGDTAAIATRTSTKLNAVYVFVRSGATWTQQQKLMASDGALGDNFGFSISLSGDTLLVGAHGAKLGNAGGAGAAYVFVRSGTTWTQQSKLVASDASGSDFFGYSISVDGDRALCAAYEDTNASGAKAGAFYSFVRSGTTWTQEQKVLPTNGTDYHRFGTKMVLRGDSALVTAELSSFAGAVYAYRRSPTGWTFAQQLVTAEPTDRFGAGLALGVDLALVGAPEHDLVNVTDAGVVFTFVRAGAPCTMASECSTGYCVDGVCCTSACSASCDRCNLAGSAGTCLPALDGDGGDPSCAPYRCDGVTTSCPTTCGSVADCVASHDCTANACTPRPLGSTCTDAAQCPSGYCVDGVCCESACDGACAMCGSTGMCTAVSGGDPGTPSCAPALCDGTSLACPSTCTDDADCVAGAFCSATGCRYVQGNGASCTAAAQCQSGHCVDGVCCDSACDGACGTCAPSGLCDAAPDGDPGTPTCAPYLCDGVAQTCPTVCAVHADCVTGTYCSNTACTPKKPDGDACTTSIECVNGTCVDGVCCATGCQDPCSACNVAGQLGSCVSLCRENTTCDATTDACVDRIGTCDGAHTVLFPDGTSTNCAPYRCANGNCLDECSSTAECVAGHVCSSSRRCVVPEEGPPADGGGCGCRSNRSDGSTVALLALGFVIVARRRRRCR